MDSTKKNILLAGGSGYLGSQLRKTLSDYNVFYTSRTQKEDALQLDFLNEKTYSSVSGQAYDLIIILASSLKGLGTTVLKEEYLDVDTKGLPDFLQYVSDQQLTKKLIYISSMTVYGTENEIPVNENAVLAPLSTYGLSKMLAEKIFGFYCASHSVKGAILRIPGIYGGARSSGYVYNTVVKCMKGLPLEIDTAGLGYWETIHIDDLCKAILNFMETYRWNASADVFNIGYGVRTDIIECARLIKEFTNSSSEIRIKNDKGYIDLYLDTSKVKAIIPLPDTYKKSLENYVKTIAL